MALLQPESSLPERGRLARDLAIISGVWILLYLTFLSHYPLIESSESRYGEVAREMAQTGNWTTPHLYYVPFLEKPALAFQLHALSIKIGGTDEAVLRLPVVLMALGTSLLVYLLGSFFFSPKVGLLAALIQLTGVEPLVVGRLVLLDTHLVFFTTLAFYCGARFYFSSEPPRWWARALAVALALACLVKGAVALVVVGLPLAIFALLPSQRRRTLHFPFLTALLLFGAILFPWHLAIYGEYPQFFKHFYLHHTFRAFYDSSVHHPGSWYETPLALLGGFLPWTFLALAALWGRFKERSHLSAESIYLLLWLFAGLAFFTFAASKLATYVLPLFPALSLLVASEFGVKKTWTRQGKEFLALTFLILPGALLLAVPIGYYLAPSDLPSFVNSGYIMAFVLLFFLLSLTSWLAWKFFRQNRAFRAVALYLTGLIPSYLIALALLLPWTEYRSVRGPALTISKKIIPGDKIYSFHDRPYGALYYLQRPLGHVGAKEEIEYGSQLAPPPEPFLWYDEIRRIWREYPRLFLILEKRDYRRHFLPKYGHLRHWKAAENKGYIVLTNFPPE